MADLGSRSAQLDDGIGPMFTAEQIVAARDRVGEHVRDEDDRDMLLDMLGLGPTIDPALFRPVPLAAAYG